LRAVIKEGVEITKVAEPGAVFGELSVLLDGAHTADVVALEDSQLYVADAATKFMQDPVTALCRRTTGATPRPSQ